MRDDFTFRPRDLKKKHLMLSFPLRNYTLLSFCVFEKKFYLRKLLNFHKIVLQKFKNKFNNSSIKNIKKVVLTKLKVKME